MHGQEGVGTGGKPRHAAWQHAPILAIAQGKQAQYQRTHVEVTTRMLVLLRPAGHLRQWYMVLQGKVVAACLHVGAKPGKLFGTEFAAQTRREAVMQLAAGIGRLDGEVVQVMFDAGAHCPFAAPPGGQGRDLQGLSQHMLRQRRQKSLQGRRFQKAAAGAVGHDELAGAHHLQQAGHSFARFGTQFQGIHPAVIHAAQHAMHAHQTVQRLEKKLVATYGQVRAPDQGQPEVARQPGLLEPGCAVRACREQDQFRGGAAFCQGQTLLAECVHKVAICIGNCRNLKLIKPVRE